MNSDTLTSDTFGKPPRLNLDDIDSWKHLFLSFAHGKNFDRIILGTEPELELDIPHGNVDQRRRIQDNNSKLTKDRDARTRLAYATINLVVQDHPDIIRQFLGINAFDDQSRGAVYFR